MAGPSVAVRAASATPRGSPHAEPEPRGTKDQEPKARIVSSARPRRWRCGHDISTSGAWAEEQRPDPAGLVPFAWRAPLGTPAGAGEEAQEKGPLWSHNGGLCERGVSIAQRCLLHPTPSPSRGRGTRVDSFSATKQLAPRVPPSRHLPSKRGCQRGTPARHGSKSSFMYTLHPRTYINTCLLILSQGCTHTEPALVLASAACVCFTAYLRLYRTPSPLPRPCL